MGSFGTAAPDSLTVTGIDHVAIVVPDLDAAIAFYADVLGLVCVHRETNEEQGVHEAMLGSGSTQIQLISPIDAQSPIAPSLERPGTRLHHVAYAVADVEAASEQARSRGLRTLYDQARHGTDGSRINFIHPKDAGGVLVELVQRRQ